MSVMQPKSITEDCERSTTPVLEKLRPLFGSKLLVTGGSGFLGAWISEIIVYLNKAHNSQIRLCILDRDKERFLEQQSHVARMSNVEFARCDTRSIVDVAHDIEYVIHAAGTPDSRAHAGNSIDVMTTISEGTSAVLRAVNRVSNLKKFVNISSSAVYAISAKNQPLQEDSPGLELNNKLANCYAEAKRYSEMLCSAARSEARIPALTLRPFTFCGPYQKLDSPWAVNNFINDALHNRPIRILGDGNATRSVMYGSDFAVWVLVLMLHGKSGQIFNIGNPEGVSLKELANTVASLLNPRPPVLLNTSLTGNVSNSNLVPDVGLAKSEFGLSVFTNTETAIRRTFAWYESKEKLR